jgi:hypothetical protein
MIRKILRQSYASDEGQINGNDMELVGTLLDNE